ncbi:hypothetical protein EAH89_13645 [Roseomonas nepalensis]|uniref:Uncharacterized protein n=1 Tax=Muricoccus nepalensis TaxID=1854500 RepID=A0A502G4S7_9PROT|nr:hypothetical protein [Roseomonas nepalensis]TPG55973.1 hypothetical protein EAH89_13645 [Roseomonas nepalensis]
MRDWGHPDQPLSIASQISSAKYFLCTVGAQRGPTLFPDSCSIADRAEGQPITMAEYHCLTDSFGHLLAGLQWRHPSEDPG